MIIMTKLLGLVALLSACHPQSRMNDRVPQSDSILNVKVNKEFIIELRTAIGQGYSWKIKDSSEKIDFIREEFKNAAADIDGMDGLQRFYFKSKSPGKSQITFIYVRPWEKPYSLTARKRTFTILTKK